MINPGFRSVDTHLHLWELGRFTYEWIEAGTLLGRDYLPEEALPLMQAAGINSCVLVEAGADDLGELHWFLDLARQHAPIAGVVAKIDVRGDVERVLSQVNPASLASLKGVRINCFDPNEDWALLANGMRALARHRLSCDLLVGAGVLPHLKSLIAAHPDVTFVLDHFGGVSITPGGHVDWRETLRTIAELPNTALKISGYLTAAQPRPLSAETLRPYLDIALDVFGASRLMYGSDWPVCTLGGAYADTVQLLKMAASALSPDEKADLWGAAAARIYRLDSQTGS